MVFRKWVAFTLGYAAIRKLKVLPNASPNFLCFGDPNTRFFYKKVVYKKVHIGMGEKLREFLYITFIKFFI